MRIVISIILMMIAIVIFVLAATRTAKYTKMRKRKEKKHPDKEYMKLDSFTSSLYTIGALLFIVALLLPGKAAAKDKTELGEFTQFLHKDTNQKDAVSYGAFRPASEPTSNPTRHNVGWEVINGTAIVTNLNRQDRIYLSTDDEYFALPGISTFRGNNYRNSATYGITDVKAGTLDTLWDYDMIITEDSVRTGCGWTGQPLVVEWDEETRQMMKMYRYKKNKDHLVEVIYPTLDGYIYFLDIEDGSPTRDPIFIGQRFNGSGSLDPRGYPLLYVGSGDIDIDGEKPRMYIISLITGRVLFTYGENDRMSLRSDNNYWCAYDSAPLIDADTDTLIWPGENGILYTFKLNTEFDKEAGTISVAPTTPVRTRYFTNRMDEEEYWYGYESSASIVDNYLYITDNGGMVFCVNLTTMELIWAQNIEDDANSSPVFERVSDKRGYIYVAPTLHWTADRENKGTISIYKIDALTGEIVWQTPYEVYNTEEATGGVQSTPLLGAKGTDIEGLVIYTIANTSPEGAGLVVALDTKTGEEVWRRSMSIYTASSPTAVCEIDGTSYVVVCDALGRITLLQGATGEGITSIDLGIMIEASPIVYKDTIVVGTRGQKIYGIEVK